MTLEELYIKTYENVNLDGLSKNDFLAKIYMEDFEMPNHMAANNLLWLVFEEYGIIRDNILATKYFRSKISRKVINAVSYIDQVYNLNIKMARLSITEDGIDIAFNLLKKYAIKWRT